ncbi:RNA polymerase sigma-70 factor (family 1) [Pedobacter africanus]|uniref:RNA polymerase sigma-70 factor (ECF subfamily) n=1 Tax=Pedobacter africanus TaxID=151894 RepID=A0ACC6L246_9SPHI|nr:RNA polymerase sigma-70 factor [Pedobacter africanus]MDR6785507.1 RNA polymerase sigma-70 factor (ECF subfamily) [Pedobacter africanus]
MKTLAEFPDTDLVLRLKAGHEPAFREVFELHFRRLYNFSFRFLKNRAQAEEIVNDAFLSLWVNRGKLNPDLLLLPYLYTIARRLALNTLRDIATSQKAMDGLWNQMEKLSNETEEMVLLNDLEQFTENAVLRLPAQQQLVFRMSRYEGLSYDEIAERLNISRNTVKNHLIAALKTLRNHFDGSDISYFMLLWTFFFK